MTGNLQVVDWSEQKSKWKHLKDIWFPRVSARPQIDMLIGLDLSDLMYSARDVRGGPGEPIARLTPLGWTCIGRSNQSEEHTNFTFFANESNNIDNLLKRYWDIEEPKVNQHFCPDDKAAVDQVSQTLVYGQDHYTI